MKQRSNKPPRRSSTRAALLMCLGVFIAIGGWLFLKRHAERSESSEAYVPRPKGQLTFNKDIAPIVFQNCAGCHRPGEAAPFALLTYEDVKRHAADIVTVTGKRYMPPWLPEHGNPRMVDERRLTADQIGVIAQWVAEGAPEGSAAEKPALPRWPEGWQLGTPDLIAELPEPYTLRAEGRDVYRNFVLPLSLPARRFVRAVEFKANTKVLHHVFIRFDRSHQCRRVDAQDAEIGFDGMSMPPSVETPGGYFLSWQPGRGPTLSPAGLAWPLEPKTDLILQAHMQPSGKPETIRPRIGFYFTDQAPTNTPFKIFLTSLSIDVPAGSTNYEIRDSYVLPVDAQVLAVLPHAHYLAKEMQGSAVLPSGETRPLLNIKEWDFNWQSDYRYAEPILLPKGTRMEMRFTYDNSSANIRNPHQPPVRVRYGLQSTDEMGELWFQILPKGIGDLRTLEMDYARRIAQDMMTFNTGVLRDNPTNAHAHVQLAKALITMDRHAEAISHLRQAVQIDSNQEEGHYQLGLLLMDSDPVSAETAFSHAVRVNPENFMARNNLGLLLMHFNRYAEAEAQFQTALELNPNDRLVLENLNMLRRRTGRP